MLECSDKMKEAIAEGLYQFVNERPVNAQAFLNLFPGCEDKIIILFLKHLGVSASNHQGFVGEMLLCSHSGVTQLLTDDVEEVRHLLLVEAVTASKVGGGIALLSHLMESHYHITCA